jgi:hypothetical protein
MAIIITITKDDTRETIKKKLNSFDDSTRHLNGFQAKKFTGKIKSFADGIKFQRKLRDEWN